MCWVLLIFQEVEEPPWVSLEGHFQGYFDLMHPVPTGSQDHLGMPRNHQIDMPFKMAP